MVVGAADPLRPERLPRRPRVGQRVAAVEPERVVGLRGRAAGTLGLPPAGLGAGAMRVPPPGYLHLDPAGALGAHTRNTVTEPPSATHRAWPSSRPQPA